MEQLIYQNQIIAYTLVRKKCKYVNFHIKANGEIYISAPKYVSKKEIEKMIFQKANWLLSNQAKIKSQKKNQINHQIQDGNTVILLGKEYTLKVCSSNQNHITISEDTILIEVKTSKITSQEYIQRFWQKWLKETTYSIAEQLTNTYLTKLSNYHLTKPSLFIRTMTSRWGSCIPSKQKITLNQNLIYPPIECFEYVVLHELAHLIEPNHSKNFYNIIEQIMPDWKKRKQLLNHF